MTRIAECFTQGLSPRCFVPRVMNFIKYHQRRRARERREDPWSRSDLLIRHHGTVQIVCDYVVAVTKSVVQLNPCASHGACELGFEMLARNDDDNARDAALGEQRMRQPGGEARFPRSRRGYKEGVLGACAFPCFKRLVLPRA